MSDLGRAAALGALDAVYQKVTGVTAGLGEADLMRPTRCAGWAVADVLYHQLLVHRVEGAERRRPAQVAHHAILRRPATGRPVGKRSSVTAE